MNKRNIVAVLFAVLVLGFCLVSPFVMSEIQNKNVIGKIRFEKKEKIHQKKMELTLLEKIELYGNSWQTEYDTEEEKKVTVFESPEEVKEEDVVKVVEKEWMNLYNAGLLAAPPSSECLKNVRYYIKTYMSSQYDFVTVWEVYMVSADGFERFEARIEKDSGKIIQLYHFKKDDYRTLLYANKYPVQYEKNDEELQKWLSNLWGDYINAKLEEVRMEEEVIGWEKEPVNCYNDGETRVEYRVLIYDNSLTIRM